MRKEKEEREQRELDEYNRMKESFAVEEQGFEQLDDAENENLLVAFLQHVKSTKVVHIDELAPRFNLSSEAVIERLRMLLDDKFLTGVFDDRGKFIYITEEELLRSLSAFLIWILI